MHHYSYFITIEMSTSHIYTLYINVMIVIINFFTIDYKLDHFATCYQFC